jgi:hypothetical protein
VKGKDHWEDFLYIWEVNVKMDLKDVLVGVWIRFIWLRIGAIG